MAGLWDTGEGQVYRIWGKEAGLWDMGEGGRFMGYRGGAGL